MDQFPPELLTIAKDMFNQYDLNKNDLIEFDELKLLMNDLAKKLSIPQPSDSDLEKIMEDTDTSKDGKISREEFLKLFSIIYVMEKGITGNN